MSRYYVGSVASDCPPDVESDNPATCIHCGAEYDLDDDAECPECGYDQSESSAPEEEDEL